MHHKIAVVGEKESVFSFKSVGFDVYELVDSQDLPSLIHELANNEYGIIFITEQILEPVQSVLEEYKTKTLPAIIPIPGLTGSLGIGMSSVRSSVERAVGADILFQEK